ncbi:protein YIPF1 [Culex pipiens pallens]|uniref:protein YIPF1 n=1 Tax=Culex pipiens pallens TaxID=42434 RepID=UPI001952CDA7|nr:protein YIPF1 [Culex pipiens pallens]
MEPSVDDLLSFKEFPLIQEGNSTSAQLNIDSPKKVSPVRETESPPEEGAATKSSTFFSFEYYQTFFDVDTMTVVERVVNSIIPKRAPTDYLQLNIGTSPDLYGPIWIVITLIFTIAISGNMASYLQNAGDHHWRYNFHLVSVAATIIVLYTSLMPLAIWALLKWFDRPTDLDESPYTPSLLSLVCLYGYSLAIYIPVSILWTIQISVFQYLLMITGFLPAWGLVCVLLPAIKQSKFSFLIQVAVAGMHLVLALALMLMFFHHSGTAAAVEDSKAAGIHEQVKTTVAAVLAHKNATN